MTKAAGAVSALAEAAQGRGAGTPPRVSPRGPRRCLHGGGGLFARQGGTAEVAEKTGKPPQGPRRGLGPAPRVTVMVGGARGA